MTAEEKKQLAANTVAIRAMNESLESLARAVGELASVANQQIHLAGLQVLVPVCGALFAEIANSSTDPGRRLDEMLAGIDGRLVRAMDEIGAASNVRAHVNKISDDVIGVAELLVRRK